jgi:3-keto-L-gulonate-6-phosphate decarboxylase
MILSGGEGWNQNVLIVGSDIIAAKHKTHKARKIRSQFLSASSGF